MADIIDIPNNFVADTDAIADDVDENFAAIETPLNELNAGTRTWDYVKSTGQIQVQALTNQLLLGNPSGNYVVITAPAPAAARTVTVPDFGAASDLLGTVGTQTVTGAKTFASGALKLQEAGSTDTATILVASLAASRSYTVPDAGASASFVMTEGAQTINGVTAIKGKTDATAVASGYIGEVVSATVSSDTNFPATTQFGNSASIALTSGNWIISCHILAESQGGTWSTVACGIGTVTGNDTTNLSRPTTLVGESFASTSTARTQINLAIPRWETRLSGSQTYYLKVSSTYSAGQPQYRGVITAVRTS